MSATTTYSKTYPIGSMYGIYANIGGILMANVTIHSIHGSYGVVRTSHSTLPQPHIRPYSKRTARTLTFDPTLTKIRNPSREKKTVHI